MMMKIDSKLTNPFQCTYNNTGFCKFREHCKYQHYYSICSKTVCRDHQCQNRHPKTCRFGGDCKFLLRNTCAYKHNNQIKSSNNEINIIGNQITTLESEIKSLETEVSKLKSIVQMKEKELEKKCSDIVDIKNKFGDEKATLNQLIAKKEKSNEAQEQKIRMLERENDDLKRQIDKVMEEVIRLKSDFKCNKCDFAAESMKNFLVHVKKHTTTNTENSENGVVKKAGCDRCDFSSTDQFSLLLHKSTKHPTYILNSQPEAETGPLH